MKWWIALLSVVGLAAAININDSRSKLNQLKWRPGTEYHFVYEGRMLTGLPELATHFSGLGIKCKVEVTVGSDYKLGLTVSEAQYVRVNQQLHGDGSSSSKNWRLIKLPAYEQVPSQHQEYLAMPIVFKFTSNGVFESLSVSQEEPEWSVNFKKALVSLLHIRYEQDALAGVETNMITPTMDRSSSSSEEEYDPDTYVDYWKTREESLDGTCDVTYQVNELPKYMIREAPEKVPYPSGCPSGSKYFGIVKTRDVASCSKRTSFVYYKPGFFRCQPGNCEGMWTRSSITRYVVCGKNRGDLRVQSIENEGELHQNLLGFKTEKFLTGTSQKLSLINEKQFGSGDVVYPRNAIVLKNLYYEYGTKPRNTDGLPVVNEGSLDEPNMLEKQLRNRHGLKGWEPSKLIPEIKKLYDQIINSDLYNIENIADKQINMKVLNLARAFTVLNKTTISHIYEELKGEFSEEEKKTMFKNVFFDTLMMGGSYSNIQFIKEKIVSGDLTKSQIVAFFTFLPQYVMTPTHSLLRSLFELVSSEHKIRESPLIYDHAVMSFSSLVQKACIADNREVSYPTYVYGIFCNPDSDVVINKWIPYLTRELNSGSTTPERKNVIIAALGMMSHKNVISTLVPYVEGRHYPHGKESGSKLTRILAVYSLSTVGRKYPALVMPMLYSIFENPAEKTSIRIAAFTVLIRSEPPMTVFHKIAASTWREKNLEVLQVVNTALYSLSQQRSIDAMEVTGSTLPRKAWLVYPLIKKTFGEFPTSASVHSYEYLRILGIGYRSTTTWVTEEKDTYAFPTSVAHRLMYFMDRYQFTPIEFGFRTYGVENVLSQIIELLDPESRNELNSGSSEMVDEIVNKVEREWSHIVRKLRLNGKGSGDESGEGALYVNFFEDSPMFFNFRSTSAQALRQKVERMLRTETGAIRDLARGEEKRLDFQTMFDLTPSELSIPSDMGLPILVEVHMPVTLSLRGKLTADLTGRRSGNPHLKMDFKMLFASQMTGWVGTVCPFTDEFALTGVEKHTVLNVPAEITTEINLAEGSASMKLNAFSGNSGSGNHIDVLTFEVRPFTVRQKIYDLTPMTLSSEFRIIQSSSALKSKSYTFGEYLGLSMKTVITSESHFLDFRTVVQKLKMVNYNPVNLFRFAWTNGGLTEAGYPSFRRHKIQFRYDPSSSTTKTIEFKVNAGYGNKIRGEGVNIHALELNNNEASFLPLRIVERALNAAANNERHQRVHQLLEELDVDSGNAFSAKFSVLFHGGNRPRTAGYTFNFVHGFKALKEKWNIHLESESRNKDLCLNGQWYWPASNPVWDIEKIRDSAFEFRYENVLGFGHNCQEHKVTFSGKSRVSDKQKDLARMDEEYRRFLERRDPALDLSQVAERIRHKSSLIDEMDFEVKYENVPAKYMVIPNSVAEYVKAIWWTYLNPNSDKGPVSSMEERSSDVSGNTQIYVRFNTLVGTFNMTVHRYNDRTIRFEHVPTPFPFSYFFPINAVKTSHHGSGRFERLTNSIASAAIGQPFHPKCKVEESSVKTWDNKSIDLNLDDCFHLLTGDCSSKKRFALLIRKSDSRSDSPKEAKIFLGKTEIKLVPSKRFEQQRFANQEIYVVVNGSEIDISSGESKTIRDRKGRFVAEIKLSSDGVTILESKWMTIAMNKRKLVVEASRLIQDKLCGLCGELNRQEYPFGECLANKPELYAANYRVDQSCQSLPEQIEQELERETMACNKFEEFPTKISRAFEVEPSHCLIHRHELLDRDSEWCFSRLPVTDCSRRCIPKPDEIKEKKVSFGCLQKNRNSNRYAEKVKRGEVLKELENLKEAFVSTMELPKKCIPLSAVADY